ncbi:MAG: methyltransferase [Solirubrobacteraceae bacterium]
MGGADSSTVAGGELPAAARELAALADLAIPLALRVACDLRMADRLAGGPEDLAVLAEQTGSHAPSLARLLRALAAHDVFCEPEPERFALGPLGQFLRTDHRLGLGDGYSLIAPDLLAWGHVDHSLATGGSAFEHVHGRPYYALLLQDADFRHRFNRSVEAQNRVMLRPLLAAYDFSRCGTLLDVAGGTGVFLGGLLRQLPGSRGILFDLPEVIAQAPAVLQRLDVADRCETVAGDFFESVPAGADTYLLKTVLHDWDDERALRILWAVREAMAPDGRLLVLEALLPPRDEFHMGKLLDVNSLVLVAGPDRDEAALRALLARAGLRPVHVIHTTTLGVIEAERG